MINKVVRYIDSLLFPPVCPFCERIMDYREESVCGNCLQILPFVLEPQCKKCGKGLKTEEDLCEDCKSNNHLYDQGRAVWKYEGIVSDSILKFKYHNRKVYGDVYARWLVKYLGKWILSKYIDVIVPVPIHKKRMEKRGYNQAEIIAEKVAVMLGIRYDNGSIIRCKNTVPQKTLSVLERMKNMQKAFKVLNSDFKDKNVLIIDDIYTTGLTMDAMAVSLKKAGAKKVYFATVSIGG